MTDDDQGLWLCLVGQFKEKQKGRQWWGPQYCGLRLRMATTRASIIQMPTLQRRSPLAFNLNQ